ncbi:MAG: methyltransferase domain-containing protein [bacterium]|nr:methyltransferase domain-containing protein [bacterium]
MTSLENIREQQRQVWNEFSSGWQKQDTFVLAWLAPIGAVLLDMLELKDGDRVLDVSTGTGEPGLTAAARVGSGSVVATDVAEEMVRIAAENARQRGMKNFTARVADANALPFDHDTFDAVVCRFGIMYFADPPAGVQELRRVLKPGRKLAVSAWTDAAKNPWAATAGTIVREMLSLPTPPPDSPGVFRHAVHGALKALFHDAGLRDLEEQEVTGRVIFDSPEHYWTFILDVVAPVAKPLAGAPEATRERVKQAVLIAARRYEHDGRIVFPWSTWVASGRK